MAKIKSDWGDVHAYRMGLTGGNTPPSQEIWLVSQISRGILGISRETSREMDPPGNSPGNGSRGISRQIWLASRKIPRGAPEISWMPRPHFPGHSTDGIPREIHRGISREIKFRESPSPGKFPGICNIRLIRGMTLPIDFRRGRLFGCLPPIGGRSHKRRIFVSPDAAPDGGHATATIRRMRHLKSQSHLVNAAD